ncbi:hypothetical protein HN873_072099 [Arachis hypogaea]
MLSGVWCDVDVVEFSYYGAPAPTPKEQLYTELADGLREAIPVLALIELVVWQVEEFSTLLQSNRPMKPWGLL